MPSPSGLKSSIEYLAISVGIGRTLYVLGTPMSDDEETDDPLIADLRNFYKVEKWTQDGMKVDSLLYAGNNLSKAQEIFANAINHRPRIRITIRQNAFYSGGRSRNGGADAIPR
jgi:hypothetical protein